MHTKISFVLPCLNEEQGIGICLDKIHSLIQSSGLNAEIVVVDNGSTDGSAAIAGAKGARVVREEERGYGAAYRRGIASASGEYIIMADADDTYDFLEAPLFIEALRQGYDFVMGSRFKGKMVRGSMPFLNRYLGNPLLSGMLRFFLKTNLSDIHCGFRAFTKEAYFRMNLKSKGMEFASEMVVAGIREQLKIKEIPVTYYPRRGLSKLSPYRDAWRHIKCMFLFSPTWLYMVPGALLFFISFFMLLLLLRGPVTIGFHPMDLHFMVLFSFGVLVGFQIISLGFFAKMYGVAEGLLKEDNFLKLFHRLFTPDKGIVAGCIIFLIGVLVNSWILIEWIRVHLGSFHKVREALVALTLSVLGLQIIFSSFFSDLFYFSKRRP